MTREMPQLGTHQTHAQPVRRSDVRQPGWFRRDGALRRLAGLNPQLASELTGPAYEAALSACRKLRPAMGLTPAEQQAAVDQLLKLASCMRAHGITGFPDPSTSGGGVHIQIGGGSVDRSSPQFQAAQKACHMPGP